MAAMNGIAFLGEIPVVMSVMEGGERGVPAAMGEGGEYYVEIAGKVVDKLG
jgi:ATP-binding protein involved in chromosome partitioning